MKIHRGGTEEERKKIYPNGWMDGETNLHDFENKSRVLEIVFEAEVDLADVFRRLRVVDVHVHQGYGTILPKGHLHVPVVRVDPVPQSQCHPAQPSPAPPKNK
jgi:hypothetical protein